MNNKYAGYQTRYLAGETKSLMVYSGMTRVVLRVAISGIRKDQLDRFHNLLAANRWWCEPLEKVRENEEFTERMVYKICLIPIWKLSDEYIACLYQAFANEVLRAVFAPNNNGIWLMCGVHKLGTDLDIWDRYLSKSERKLIEESTIKVSEMISRKCT